jgi:hypothetical protein
MSIERGRIRVVRNASEPPDVTEPDLRAVIEVGDKMCVVFHRAVSASASEPASHAEVKD